MFILFDRSLTYEVSVKKVILLVDKNKPNDVQLIPKFPSCDFH